MLSLPAHKLELGAYSSRRVTVTETVELQAVIGQLYLIEGATQDTAASGPQGVPGVLAISAPPKAARGRERDSLFVHLSLSGPPAGYSELAQTLLDLIRDHYYQSSGGVTSALRTAIMEANQRLLRVNISGKGALREGALVCAVMRGQELFMVQTGEAFALIARNFGVERLPAGEPDRMTPLGRTAGLDLRYFHNWLEPGDMLLLADPRLTNLPAEAVKRALVDSTVEEALPQLRQMIGQETARLLLVEFIDEAPPDLPDVMVAAPTAAPRRDIRPAGQKDNPPPAQNKRKSSPPQVVLPSAEEVQDTARQATSRAAIGAGVATGWLADLMGRLRPPREAQTRSNGRGSDDGWALPALIAVLIPIIVAVIVTSVFVQRGRVQRMSEIKRDMNEAIGLAAQTDDALAQRTYYNEVLLLAAEAEVIRPDDPDVQRLRQTALVQTDLIEDVTRLAGRRLYTYPAGANMGSLVLREGLNGDIFALDRGTGRVFRHETAEDFVTFTAETASEILFSGQAVGNQIVGTLFDMTWRSRDTQVSEAGLTMLDRAGLLTTFVPTFGELQATKLGLASEWQNPVAITYFNERMYVLDPGAARIWRYFAEGSGFFVDEEQRAIELPDLDKAVDIDIYAEDGSILVLYGDGRMRRYVNGSLLWEETNLRDSGMTTPLIAPTRLKIIGRGLNSSIFVADPGSGRIIQLSLGGTFLAQYKAVDLETDQELFTNMGDFDIAESPLRIFVTTSNGLYVATQN